ncbi:hypothetical protein TTHERM_00058920 (macronuclear) [Tetrahymena thermophila SB210]|uniref:Uncharacterized protein n=1 Tax=Tetrahymena thermophila (strain SB210) TaxID=312017 RepID=I7LTV8_TETTS|nr:hypothetical protein TTHERM_00058920 [Tetrahymena thermophila SB210]EAR87380.1 hypothetical protein TTHERM_00058920 [Tetrahymena thermophila SB210]|eukprot:XP_001007625.1 hypothetical protein TTHERM_00058920 [Tetrahymena thermophila SB210]
MNNNTFDQSSASIASGQFCANGNNHIILKNVIINFHQYLLEFLQQQKDLSAAFPSMCNLTQDSFQKLANMIEQTNYILYSQKRYESLSASQRAQLFNKQKEWVQRAEYLKKIQLNQHLNKNQNSSKITDSPVDNKLYNDFINQKKMEQLKNQKENLIRKLFLKKKQEEIHKQRAVDSQKTRKILPEVPDFEEEIEEPEVQEIDMQFENFNYVPMNEKQYEDNSSSSFFDSSSTGLTESPVRSINFSTASYRPISSDISDSKIEIVYNQINQKSENTQFTPIANQINKKKQQQQQKSKPRQSKQNENNNSNSQISNKFLQKKYQKLEECIISLIEKLQLTAEASQQIFKMAQEIIVAILNDKDFFKNKSFEIISEAIVLYASKLANFPITIKALTEIVSDKERCINKVYNHLVGVLPQYKSIQIAEPELLIKEIVSVVNAPEEILYASQYLYQNIYVNGLLKGEHSSIVSSSVVLVSCLLNGINIPLNDYANALNVQSNQLQNYSNFIISNSKILINNPALFKQSSFILQQN